MMNHLADLAETKEKKTGFQHHNRVGIWGSAALWGGRLQKKEKIGGKKTTRQFYARRDLCWW